MRLPADWMTNRRALPLFCCLALLAGCSLAPQYHRPQTVNPSDFKEAAGWTQAQPADAITRGAWWEMFGNAELNDLEVKAGVGNQNLKAALARFEEARLLAAAARAAYFPIVTANATDIRERSSPNFSTITTGKPYNDYLASADFSYEIDLWGRVRNTVSGAKSRAQASAADFASAELSLRAELAGDYFALRGDDAAQAILDETVAAYRKALDLTHNRFQGGIAAEADVDQAQAQFETARTQAADMQLKRSQLEHAIAVLVGVPPANFSLPPEPLDGTPPAIQPDVPATLLERRPDIASAERLVKAANADIGIARAAYFPDLSLSGTAGFESASWGNLFTYPSRVWSLGPSALLTIFDAGRISALTDEARAAYDEAAANYRQTVLTAFQQVEDNLVALHRLEEESESAAAASQAAGRSLKQSQDRYTGGIVTYLDVVIAQNTALQARLAASDILTRRMVASVQLIKALGGGWHPVALDKVAVTQPSEANLPIAASTLPDALAAQAAEGGAHQALAAVASIPSSAFPSP